MQLLATADVCQKLKELRRHVTLTGIASVYTYEFADFLADELAKRERIDPGLFLLKVELAFIDLQHGRYESGLPVTHRAALRVPALESFIRMDMPRVVDAVFPPAFAAGIRQASADALTASAAFRKRTDSKSQSEKARKPKRKRAAKKK